MLPTYADPPRYPGESAFMDKEQRSHVMCAIIGASIGAGVAVLVLLTFAH